MDLISIIVPVYNVGVDIDRCLKSICEQSYSRLEIILIDDGSTDDSGERCDKWANRDSRIRVIHKKNGGVSSARNAGINLANGKYITFVDPDDYLEPNIYFDIIGYCSKYDIVGFGFYLETFINGEQKKRIQTSGLITSESKEKVIENNFFRLIGLSIDDLRRWNRGGRINKNRAKGMIWQFVFKANLIKSNKIYFDTKIILKEDEIFLLECLRFANNLKIIQKPYYNYVQRTSSISYRISDENKLKNKFSLLESKNKIRTAMLNENGVDVLPLYAASNALSVLEVGLLCAKLQNGYQIYMNYIREENVLESVDMAPIEICNYKFNVALLFMKCHAYWLLYIVIKCFTKLGINMVPNNIV